VLEYKIVKSRETQAHEQAKGPEDFKRRLLEEFSKLSEEGWELVAIEGSDYYFKRIKR